jgi:hypothetical protein
MQQIQDKSGPVLAYRAVSLLTVLLLILQPILIGQHLYTSSGDGWKDAHAMSGNIAHLTALVSMILAFLARRTFGIGLGVFNLVIFVLIVIQGGLGFSDDDNSRALHIPLGTFLLTMSAFAAFLGFFDIRSQRRLPTETHPID